MKTLSICTIILAALFSLTLKAQDEATEFLDFKLNALSGEEVPMSSFKGKVVIVVNTASKCGLTPQYEGLEALYKKYKDQGLVILGMPCNQFLGQEPGSSSEIAEFCQKNYGVSFPMFEKIEVRGENAHPLYKMMTSQKPFMGFDDSESGQKFKTFLSEKFPEIYEGNGVKWNFTKFIIDRSGNLVRRIEPNIHPKDFEKEISEMLSDL